MPRIGKEFAGTFQNVVEACANQTGDPRDADDEKALVLLAFVAGKALELRAAAIEVGLQHVRGHEERGGDHQAESGNRDRPNMQKRNHKLDSRVYTRAAASLNAAAARRVVLAFASWRSRYDEDRMVRYAGRRRSARAAEFGLGWDGRGRGRACQR